jgi:hypothetical protein
MTERYLRGGSSRYKGVSLSRHAVEQGRKKVWRSVIKKNGFQIHLGIFVTEVEAARAYDQYAVLLFGPNATTNETFGLYERTA